MGPLQGLRIVEFAALGPAPMAAMILADLGAEVLRIERPLAGESGEAPLFDPRADILLRNRRVVRLDLKQAEAVAALLDLIGHADGLVEGFRPGVLERLGLGPQTCLERNPRLVYGRMTGWGQHGPLAKAAGHDINYLSLSGALHAIGEPGGRPTVPLNLVADGGGGAMLLVVGILAALLEARTSGRGQVVDAAMTDGSALLTTMIYSFKAMGAWSPERGTNILDGGAPFYGTYRCRDGKWLAVGAIEPQFYGRFLELAGIVDPDFRDQWRRERWPALRERLAAVIATRDRDDWCTIMAGTDACVAPVLDLDEAPRHPHNLARQTFVEVDGLTQPAPAPRFSRSVADPPVRSMTDTGEMLSAWGVSPAIRMFLTGERP